MGCHLEVAHTEAAALEALKSWHRFTGILIDAELSAGASVGTLLEGLRARGMHAPVLLLTPSDPNLCLVGQRHGAYVLTKPISRERVDAFIHWAREQRVIPHAYLEAEVRAFGFRYGLTPRELEVVKLAASGIARQELMTALDVEESTVKTTIRRLLRKARRSSLAEIVSEMHRAVFLASADDGSAGFGGLPFG